MAFKLAEAFVELALRDSELLVGLARVNRAVDETHGRLASLAAAATGTSALSAVSADALPNQTAARDSEFGSRATARFDENRFPLPETNANPPSPNGSSFPSGSENLTQSFESLADPLRELASSLARSSAANGLDAPTTSDAEINRSFDRQASRFAENGVTSDPPPSPSAASSERADRQRQQQLEVLTRLAENVRRILEIQESRHASGTAVFSPPA